MSTEPHAAHTGRGSSYPIAHILHYPTPPPVHSVVLGPAVIYNNPLRRTRFCSNKQQPAHDERSESGKEREREKFIDNQIDD